MENEINQRLAQTMISRIVKAKEIWIKQEYINQEEQYQPGIINTVIRLLEEGNLSSAKKSFQWESDKLLNNRPVYDFLAEVLNEKNIFASGIAENIKQEIPKWIDKGEVDEKEEFQPRTMLRIIQVLEEGDLPFARRLLRNETGKIFTKETMFAFLCKVLDIENIFIED